MRPYSIKRSKQIYEYKKVRAEFLKRNPLCEVCGGVAIEIHHKKGRTGELLNDNNYFLPVCRPCHNHIEDNPNWAKEKGYSVNRL